MTEIIGEIILVFRAIIDWINQIADATKEWAIFSKEDFLPVAIIDLIKALWPLCWPIFIFSGILIAVKIYKWIENNWPL